MAIKNIKTLLLDATKYPAALEAQLPAGAPKVSEMLANAANQIPALPDFPMEIPDLPAAPALPAMPVMPKMPGQDAGLRRYVSAVEVRQAPTPTPANRTEVIPSPAVGVLPEVVTRRGM